MIDLLANSLALFFVAKTAKLKFFQSITEIRAKMPTAILYESNFSPSIHRDYQTIYIITYYKPH